MRIAVGKAAVVGEGARVGCRGARWVTYVEGVGLWLGSVGQASVARVLGVGAASLLGAVLHAGPAGETASSAGNATCAQHTKDKTPQSVIRCVSPLHTYKLRQAEDTRAQAAGVAGFGRKSGFACACVCVTGTYRE